MKLNELTQEQRNALCAFGQADQDATAANLMIAGAAAVKPEAVKVLTELADRLYRLPVSDTEYQTLADNGVETLVHYPCPPHLQKCYPQLAHYNLPVTERMAREVVSLPISPACTSLDDAREIAAIINKFSI